jgi:hypothetical protein
MLNEAAALSAHEFEENKRFDRGFVYKAFRCEACPTELVVEVLPSRVRRGSMPERMRRCPRVLTVTRYIDVGPCMTPEETEWKALTRKDEKQLENFAARRPIAERLGEQDGRRPIIHVGDTWL